MPAQVTFKSTLIFSSISLLALSSPAHSAGFSSTSNSASGMGNAFAGSAAVAEDASTVWFNPAGMTYLGEKLEGKSLLSNAAHIVAAKTDYEDKGSAAPAALNATMSGEKDISADVTSFIPNLYYMRPLNEKMHFGLSVNGPFGSKTLYDKDWMGRYQATETDMKSVNINPAISWKANDKLSLGAGVSGQYLHVKLGKAFDSVGVCRAVALGAAARSNDTSLINYCNAQYPKAAQVDKDSQALVEGKSFGFGFNVGLLYQPTAMTRIGASYRSKVKHKLKGDATYQVDAALKPIVAGLEAQGNNRFTDRDITAKLTLPDSVSLSLVHKVNSKLELLGDVTWTQWSTFQELRVVDKTGADVTSVPQKWKDVTRVSVGANYQYNDKLTLRTGVAFDQEPIPSAQFRTPRSPGNDRTWLSVGAGYKLNKKMTLDFGYSHLFLDETPIDNSGTGYSVRGLYNSSVDILSAQVNYKF